MCNVRCSQAVIWVVHSLLNLSEGGKRPRKLVVPERFAIQSV